MQKIQLNIIPFTPVASKGTFSFYGEKQKGFAPIYWGKIMETFPEGREAKHKNYYTDFQEPREGAITKEVKFADAINFSLHYFRHLVFNYFKSIQGAIVFPNYVNDIEVWFKDTSHTHPKYQLYQNYSIKVQFNEVIKDTYELVIAYNGTSKILHQTIQDIDDIDAEDYNLVNYHSTLYKYNSDYIPDNIKQQIDKLYPVLSNTLKKILLPEEYKKEENSLNKRKPENKFPVYFNFIQSFFTNHINTASFKKIFKLNLEGLYILPQDKVKVIPKDSALLEFRDNKDVSPSWGIYKHKPYKTNTQEKIKIFFIYHKADGKYIEGTLFEYITNGFNKLVKGQQKTINKLKAYINQEFSIERDKRIVFENTDTIFEEVSAQLKTLKEANTRFVAIYISPISKSETDHPQHLAYYKIKELLLYKDISSQVLYKEHLNKEDFYYFIPNIYVALLAKMGGIPWRIANPKDEEIVIGVGAFKPANSKHRFVGSAFSFNNDGVFNNFNCFREDESYLLAGSISNAIDDFIENKKIVKRVIIHFYKEISDKRELQPILDMLDSKGMENLPIIIVTINKTESKELLGFDVNNVGKMPISGTYFRVGYHTYLLFNNVRYEEDTKLGVKDYHFPIKLSITSTNKEILNEDKVINELIDQVYQFSRVYWKSVSLQNLPVTTKYPEMVAEIYPHFENENLPEFGKKNLWFL